MKNYIIYGLAVLGLIFWASSKGSVIVDWADLMDDGDGGGSGGYYHSGGGYHK